MCTIISPIAAQRNERNKLMKEKYNPGVGKGSFKSYVTLFLAKICPSLPPVTVRNVSNMSVPSLCYVTKSLTPTPLLIENKVYINNLRCISKRCFNTQFM